MERLHTRLYEKYRNLKKRRLTEASECSAKVQGDFEKYATAVESMLEELKSENNELYEKISSLEDSNAEYQQSLMEKHRKVEELSNEVERLRKAASDEEHRNPRPESGEVFTLVAPLNVAVEENLESDERMKSNLDAAPHECSPNGTNTFQDNNQQNEQPLTGCFDRKMTNSSTGDGKEKEYARYIHQMLIESLVGMKFSVENQDDDGDTHLSFTHQSSGYSFTLTWLRKGEEDEGEFLYRVSSLGTIENVAMDWMKEELLFSMAMCHSFFGRISRILGRHF